SLGSYEKYPGIPEQGGWAPLVSDCGEAGRGCRWVGGGLPLAWTHHDWFYPRERVMRIAIVGSGGIDRHPPSRAFRRAYEAAGHDVRLHPRATTETVVDADLVVPAIRGDVGLAEAVVPAGAKVAAPPSWSPDP